MLATGFIQKKRFGGEHSKTELAEFISGFVEGHVPDYQVAAWLMAVCLKGMSFSEAADLTEVMLHSGKTLKWDLKSKFIPADKHSTGGIGDKTSLIIAPLVASFGIPVPMMAGRGLGFTGGTLDKLESIPGFQTRISMDQFKNQMEQIGLALMGQTDEICPADRKMYALRDVTGTVESVPLICASILSKKIAEGAKALVMDVKVGSGAFMQTLDQARELAKALKKIGALGGMKISALITDMNQPLGRFVGNALEVHECLEIMKGRGGDQDSKDFSETTLLSIELSAHMLFLVGYSTDLQACRDLCMQNLANGKCLEKFEELVSAQGGNLKDFELDCSETKEITAKESGYFHLKSNKDIGLALLWLGGGRKAQTDVIDPQVGIEILVRNGETVTKGQALFKIHLNADAHLAAATNHLHNSFEVIEKPPQLTPLILEVIN